MGTYPTQNLPVRKTAETTVEVGGSASHIGDKASRLGEVALELVSFGLDIAVKDLVDQVGVNVLHNKDAGDKGRRRSEKVESGRNSGIW